MSSPGASTPGYCPREQKLWRGTVNLMFDCTEPPWENRSLPSYRRMRPTMFIGCKSLCVIFSFLQALSLAAAVIWNGAESDEWNTVAHNWLGDPVFQPGYDVTINGSFRIFIGVDRVPIPVAPRSLMTSGSVTLWGGDIQTGGILLSGFSSLMFSNYSASLSFPGDLRVRGGGQITYDIREAPHNSQLNLGAGNIFFEDGALAVLVGTGKVATLTNPLIISNTATLRLQEFG